MSGGGTLSNTNAVAMNHADIKLKLNSITVAKESTSVDNSGRDVDSNSTVISLTVGYTTAVSIASGITLSGGIAVTAGSIKPVSDTHLTLTTTIRGGISDVDETLKDTGALTQYGSVDLHRSDDHKLPYSETSVCI